MYKINVNGMSHFRFPGAAAVSQVQYLSLSLIYITPPLGSSGLQERKHYSSPWRPVKGPSQVLQSVTECWVYPKWLLPFWIYLSTYCNDGRYLFARRTKIDFVYWLLIHPLHLAFITLYPQLIEARGHYRFIMEAVRLQGFFKGMMCRQWVHC